jgi:hypothetical protein
MRRRGAVPVVESFAFDGIEFIPLCKCGASQAAFRKS